MKALCVTPYPILPLSHGGRVRAFRLSAALAAAGADVGVLYPWAPGLPPRPVRRGRVTYMPQAFLANAVPRLVPERIVPTLVTLSWQPYALAQRRRRGLLAAADVAEFHFPAYAAWMERAPRSTKIVYVAHNVEVDFAAEQSPRLLPERMLRRVAELERRAVEASDLVVTCTEADAERLRALYGTGFESLVLPNGVDERLVRLDRGSLRREARAALGLDPERRVILFVGGPARHNREAVDFLERELLPALDAPATLVVAGECAKAARSRSVLKLGFVDDLRPLFAAADVGVNPAAYGSGSQLKLAEYVAAGLPTVTTPIGLRGYEALAGHVRVAELADFAAAVAETGGRNGGPPPVADLTWTALGRRLHGAYERLLER